MKYVLTYRPPSSSPPGARPSAALLDASVLGTPPTDTLSPLLKAGVLAAQLAGGCGVALTASCSASRPAGSRQARRGAAVRSGEYKPLPGSPLTRGFGAHDCESDAKPVRSGRG